MIVKFVDRNGDNLLNSAIHCEEMPKNGGTVFIKNREFTITGVSYDILEGKASNNKPPPLTVGIRCRVEPKSNSQKNGPQAPEPEAPKMPEDVDSTEPVEPAPVRRGPGRPPKVREESAEPAAVQ